MSLINTSPKVWLEFEAGNQKYWIQNVEEHQKKLVADAMTYGFLRDEPISMYYDRSSVEPPEHNDFMEKVKESYLEILEAGRSIVCMTKKNNEPTVAGIQCLEVTSVAQPTESLRIGTNFLNYMLGLKNICQEFNMLEYLVDRGLFVLPEFRRNGIAVRLLECWPLVSKDARQDFAMGVFSSKYSQAAARRAGFTEALSLLYEDIRKEAIVDVPLGVESHTEGMSLFFVKS